MSRKYYDYSKQVVQGAASDEPTPEESTKVEEEIGIPYPVEEVETEVVQPVVVEEEVNIPVAPVIGVVTDCIKLNMRNAPNKDADVVYVLPLDTKVEVLLNESTDDFYKVAIETGAEGYCMKQFINIDK